MGEPYRFDGGRVVFATVIVCRGDWGGGGRDY